jgi:hypothetical protein
MVRQGPLGGSLPGTVRLLTADRIGIDAFGRELSAFSGQLIDFG